MDDLRAVMDAAGSERAALFGVSEGGPMCQLFAATFPERVTALVLYGTYARMVEGDGYDIGVPSEMLGPRFSEIMSRDWGSPMALGMFAPSVAKDERFREYWGRLLRSASSPKSAVALMDLYRQIDTRSALSSISAPTLVMHRRAIVPRPWPGAATWPRRSRGRATSSSTATTTCRWSIRTRSSTSWRSS